ncbi:AAA family ATPase [Kribbella aluminosa]
MSLGQRMRGDLVAAMLHEPSILFLDEPTVGLDVVAKARLTEFIAETNRTAGTTVVLTTHDMDDVERLCQRIIVIDSGTVLYDGDLSRLKERFMPYRLLVLTLAERSIRRVADIPFATEVDSAAVGTVLAYPDRSVVLRFDPREITTPELIARVSQVYQVDELSIVDPRLTDVISQLYDGLLT